MIEMMSTKEESDIVFKLIKKNLETLIVHDKGNYAVLASLSSLDEKQQV